MRLINWVQASTLTSMKKRGLKRHNPHIRRVTKASQIKLSQNKGTKPDKDMLDALLGDPIVNTKKNTEKAKATGGTV